MIGFFLPTISLSSAPRGLSGFTRGPTSITLSWFIDINIDHFVVEVKEIQTQRLWRFDTVNTYFNVTSLHPYYIYGCRVAAVAVFHGPFSTPVQVRTEEDGKMVNTEYIHVTSAKNIEMTFPFSPQFTSSEFSCHSNYSSISISIVGPSTISTPKWISSTVFDQTQRCWNNHPSDFKHKWSNHPKPPAFRYLPHICCSRNNKGWTLL